MLVSVDAARKKKGDEEHCLLIWRDVYYFCGGFYKSIEINNIAVFYGFTRKLCWSTGGKMAPVAKVVPNFENSWNVYINLFVEVGRVPFEGAEAAEVAPCCPEMVSGRILAKFLQIFNVKIPTIVNAQTRAKCLWVKTMSGITNTACFDRYQRMWRKFICHCARRIFTHVKMLYWVLWTWQVREEINNCEKCGNRHVFLLNV